VLAVKTTGLADYESCTKYAGYPCPGPTKTLVVVDVGGSWPGPSSVTQFSTGTATGQLSGLSTNLARVLLSSAGGLAWLTKSGAGTPSEPAPVLKLYGCVLADAASGPTCAAAQLDMSAVIDPASLRLQGTTLTWNVGDQTQSETLS
jgi:hypothetical protein